MSTAPRPDRPMEPHRGVRVGDAAVPGPSGRYRLRAATLPVDLAEGITDTTRALYTARLEAFADWCVKHAFCSPRWLAGAGPRVYNSALKAQLQQMVCDQAPIPHGMQLVAAFMHKFPWTRGMCAEAWRALRVWQNSVPSVSRLPLDRDLHRAMVALALYWKWPRLALALAIAFVGYLRPAEAANICKQHVRFLRKPSGVSLAIAIVRPKTRFRAARLQAIAIQDLEVVSLASKVLPNLAARHKLLPGGTADLSVRFAALLAALGAGSLGYTPGSLRPGGIVSDFVGGDLHLTEAMFQGRWVSVRSVTRYLQAGMSAWAAADMPEEVAILVDSLAPLLQSLIGSHSADAR